MSCLTSIKNNDLISVFVTLATHFIGAKGLDHTPSSLGQASIQCRVGPVHGLKGIGLHVAAFCCKLHGWCPRSAGALFEPQAEGAKVQRSYQQVLKGISKILQKN